MKAYSILILLIGVFILMGCENKDPLSANSADDVQLRILDQTFDAGFPQDPAVIDEALIEGDLLKLKVSYSGGYETHDFALIFQGVFMESNPVQADLFLSHDAHDDPAEAWITEELQFDLTPLKMSYKNQYGGGGPVYLRLHEPGVRNQFKALLIYEFE